MALLRRLALVLGLLCSLAAVVASYLWPERPFIIAVTAFLGVVLLGYFFLVHFEAFREYSRQRSTHLRLNSLLMVATVLFIVVMLNLIVRQYYLRVDLTSMKRFSLSEITLNVLDSVRKPLKVMYFGSENSKEFERMQYLLDAYRYYNKNILYDLYDLDRVPLIAKRYEVRNYGTVVVETEGRYFKDQGSDEQTVTNLIIRATRKTHPWVRFLQGHEEHTLSLKDRSGYGKVVEVLKKSGFRVSALYLTETNVVPPDTDVLVIGSPEKEIPEREVQLLRHFLLGGGKLVVLLDRPGQLKRLLQSFYLTTSEYPVYDTQYVAAIGPSAPLVKEYYYSELSTFEDFHQETFFPGVYEIRFYGPPKDYKVHVIARTTKESWYEKNGDGRKQKDEEEGLQSIVVAVVPKNALWRVVVCGDSDFITNAYAGLGGNGELFIRLINWLVGEGSLTSITTKRGQVIPLFVTDRQLQLVRLITVAVPVAVVLAGAIVWFRRRRL